MTYGLAVPEAPRRQLQEHLGRGARRIDAHRP